MVTRSTPHHHHRYLDISQHLSVVSWRLNDIGWTRQLTASTHGLTAEWRYFWIFHQQTYPPTALFKIFFHSYMRSQCYTLTVQKIEWQQDVSTTYWASDVVPGGGQLPTLNFWQSDNVLVENFSSMQLSARILSKICNVYRSENCIFLPRLLFWPTTTLLSTLALVLTISGIMSEVV